ncbi:MAG TPA: hypothetical protein VGY58_01120, partial [Gemmataceae bacterium]|nr:hypothetical protein [Gemmataceae bacterium]
AVGPAAPGVLSVFDGQLRRRLELQIHAPQGYRIRAGVEYPRAGLTVLRAWEALGSGQELTQLDLTTNARRIMPRR